MGSKTRLSSYCTKRANKGVNLVTSRKINTRLARPIEERKLLPQTNMALNSVHLVLGSSPSSANVGFCTISLEPLLPAVLIKPFDPFGESGLKSNEQIVRLKLISRAVSLKKAIKDH